MRLGQMLSPPPRPHNPNSVGLNNSLFLSAISEGDLSLEGELYLVGEVLRGSLEDS